MTVHAIDGSAVPIPDGQQLIHLQFRRFAGCPVCNLHLQTMARRHEDIWNAGVRQVVVFHSSPEALSAYVGHLPFVLIADPEKALYKQFGVESSFRAVLHPLALGGGFLGIIQTLWRSIRHGVPLPPLFPKGGGRGLPADFLIAPDGQVIACYYGEHADDQWSTDELLFLALRYRRALSMEKGGLS